MEKIEKHQDYIYLKKRKNKKPKEIFIFIKNLIRNKNHVNLLDVGCADGELLGYLDNFFNKSNFFGLDYSSKLISEAKKKKIIKNNVNFKKVNFLNYNLNKKFDYIIMSGVISYFDNSKIIIEKISKNLKKNGSLILLDNFNKYNIDVRIRYRDNVRHQEFKDGWNYHSIVTIKNNLKKKFSSIKTKKFKLSFKLKKRKEDLTRSWHHNFKKGQFTNGLGLLFYLTAIIAKKN